MTPDDLLNFYEEHLHTIKQIAELGHSERVSARSAFAVISLAVDGALERVREMERRVEDE